MSYPLTSEQRQVLTEKILDFNDTLATQRINLSGQAFSNAFKLGCGVMAVPVVIVLLISYLIGKFSAISIFVYLCAGTMVAAVFASLVATRAKKIALDENYQQDLSSDIAHFLSEHEFTQEQFTALAEEILAEDAPLRVYLTHTLS